MSKLAVVLFNLGGPDRPESVKPFLFNLFNDPAIIGAPRPIRWLLARLISGRRAPVARAIYARIGGKSPLLEMTGEQATALERLLGTAGEAKVFVAMRYWHPMSDEVAVAVRAFAPDEIVLLPLYPQYSTTTSGSSLSDWRRAAAAAGIGAPTVAVCCYPGQPGLIDLHAHVFGYSGSLWPDDTHLLTGTTVVDCGGSGWRTFETFKETVIDLDYKLDGSSLAGENHGGFPGWIEGRLVPRLVRGQTDSAA